MLRSTLSHLALVPNPEADAGPLEGRGSEILWTRLRREAEEAVAKEPMLATLFFNSILSQPSFEAAIFHRIASRLGNEILRPSVIADVCRQAGLLDQGIDEAVRADIAAVMDRDPACERFIEPFLQGLRRDPGAPGSALAVDQRSPGFRAIPAEPLVGCLSDRHPSGGALRARNLS